MYQNFGHFTYGEGGGSTQFHSFEVMSHKRCDMINLTIQFLKRITKLTIKHQGGEGGLREV